MTARSVRRAQERKARKLARKATPAPSPEGASSISEAQLAANRENAQLSTGPQTTAGKAASSRNALKTGLTGRTVLLSEEEAEAYQLHVEAYAAELQPSTQRERDLVQSLADTAWRLQRVPVLEMALFAQGRLEFSGALDENGVAFPLHLVEAKTLLAYERQFRNLHLQEARLQRRREKELAELKALQDERALNAADSPAAALAAFLSPGKQNTQRKPAKNGFDFSTSGIGSRLDEEKADQLITAFFKSAQAAEPGAR